MRDDVYIDANTVITFGSLIGALIAIGGALVAIYKWIEKQNKQDEDIKSMKSELCLLTYGLLACLKGLKEQGCNGPVTEAIEKIEKRINKQAHEQDE